MVRVGCQMRERVYLRHIRASYDVHSSVLSPEHEVRISPCLAGVHLIGPIILGQGHLHELGSVESEGEDSHGDDVDQQALSIAHRLPEE